MINFRYLNGLLDELGFDWSQYTIERFTNHLAVLKERTITYLPSKMPLEIDGVWLTSKYQDEEFIFFDRNVVPYFQETIKLHELSHMVIGDKTEFIDPANVTLFQERLMNFPSGAISRSRWGRKEKKEIMADTLGLMIFERFNQAKSSNQPYTVTTSDFPNLLEVMG